MSDECQTRRALSNSASTRSGYLQSVMRAERQARKRHDQVAYRRKVHKVIHVMEGHVQRLKRKRHVPFSALSFRAAMPCSTRAWQKGWQHSQLWGVQLQTLLLNRQYSQKPREGSMLGFLIKWCHEHHIYKNRYLRNFQGRYCNLCTMLQGLPPSSRKSREGGPSKTGVHAMRLAKFPTANSHRLDMPGVIEAKLKATTMWDSYPYRPALEVWDTLGPSMPISRQCPLQAWLTWLCIFFLEGTSSLLKGPFDTVTRVTEQQRGGGGGSQQHGNSNDPPGKLLGPDVCQGLG